MCEEMFLADEPDLRVRAKLKMRQVPLMESVESALCR
jgi:hypothetical protein